MPTIRDLTQKYMNARETRTTILAGVLLALVVGLTGRGETSSQAPDSASAEATADVAVKIPEWTAPEAAVRILTAPIHKKRHTLWLELPEQLQDKFAGADVYNFKGRPLTYYPIFRDDRLIAVEITLTSNAIHQMRVDARASVDEAPPTQIVCYLFEKPLNKKFDETSRTPVKFTNVREVINARPMSCGEYRHLAAIRKPLIYYTETKYFAGLEGAILFRKKFSTKQNIHFRLTTNFHVPESGTYEFAVRNSDCGAWFVFINDKGLFSWADSKPSKGDLFRSPPMDLELGYHRMVFAGMRISTEAVPNFVYRRSGDGDEFRDFAQDQLYAANAAETIMVQRQGAALIPGIQLRQTGRFVFPHSGAVIGIFDAVSCSQHTQGAPITEWDVVVDGTPFDDPGTRRVLFLPQRRYHDVTVRVADGGGNTQTLGVRIAEAWTRTGHAHVTFRIGQLPLLEPIDGKLTIRYRLSYPESFADALMSHATVKATALDRNGKRLDTQSYSIPKSPLERLFDYRMVAGGLKRIELKLALGDTPLDVPITIHRVESNDSLLAFHRRGSRLRIGDALAIVRRESPRFSTDGIALPTPTGNPPAVDGRQGVVLVDDFIATRRHFTNNLDIESWLNDHSRFAFQHVPLTQASPNGRYSVFAKFEQLGPILKTDARFIVWNIGVWDLHAGFDLRDFRSQIIFLVNASLAHNKFPVLVTPPVFGDLRRTRIRPYALLIKELGARYDLPVVDYYSASILLDAANTFYNVPEAGGVLSGTPNAKGRRWFLSLMLQTIEDFLENNDS